MFHLPEKLPSEDIFISWNQMIWKSHHLYFPGNESLQNLSEVSGHEKPQLGSVWMERKKNNQCPLISKSGRYMKYVNTVTIHLNKILPMD
jgi:hypothetical protein